MRLCNKEEAMNYDYFEVHILQILLSKFSIFSANTKNKLIN